MTATVEALSHDALVLPTDQRVALAYRLLVSVEPEPEPGAAAAWEAEIAQRIARFAAGDSQPIPAAEVFPGYERAPLSPKLCFDRHPTKQELR